MRYSPGMPLFYRHDLRIMWADADAAGIAWFGHYFRFFENVEEELFRHLGRDRTALLTQLNILMPRTSLKAGFRSPARLGDDVSVGIGVMEITERRIGYAFDIRARRADRLICEASYRVACVDATTFEAKAFPAEIASLLAPALVRPD
jgi:YbgC/YbaW family acyl-CoA thioester hydrolase